MIHPKPSTINSHVHDGHMHDTAWAMSINPTPHTHTHTRNMLRTPSCCSHRLHVFPQNRTHTVGSQPGTKLSGWAHWHTMRLSWYGPAFSVQGDETHGRYVAFPASPVMSNGNLLALQVVGFAIAAHLRFINATLCRHVSCSRQRVHTAIVHILRAGVGLCDRHLLRKMRDRGHAFS